jgi:hypothetical protein
VRWSARRRERPGRPSGLTCINFVVGKAQHRDGSSVGCLDLETLDRLHQLAQAGGRAALDFMKEQFKSGECSNLSQIGASVRADQRVKTEVCIVPAGSSEPCRWVPSQVVK